MLERGTPSNRRLVGESATGHTILEKAPALAAPKKRKTKIVGALTKGIDGLFKKNKVTRYAGTGRIMGPGHVRVDGKDAVDIEATHIVIATGMGDGRNVINVLSSDVVIACPGALGTLCEITLALNNGKHVVLLGRASEPSLGKYERRGQLTLADRPEQAVEQAALVLSDKYPAS